MAKLFKKSAGSGFSILLAAVLTGLITIILTENIFFSFSPIEDLKLKFLDDRFDARGKIELPVSSEIIILEINKESYAQIPAPMNRWPWPRNLFAHVLRNLKEAGAKGIGLDIVMSDPDTHSAANDSILFYTIKELGNVVVAGKLDVEREYIFEQLKSKKAKVISSGRHQVITKFAHENYSNLFFGADSSIGIVQVWRDDDGVARRYYPYVFSQITQRKVPSFGFALLNKYYNLPPNFIATKGNNYFSYFGKTIPKYDDYSFLINFYGSNQSEHFKRVPFIDALDDKDFKTTDELELGVDINTFDDPDFGLLKNGVFKDKIVLIGSTMPEDRDIISVSVAQNELQGSNQIFGVFFHANAIQNVIDNNFISVQSISSVGSVSFLLTVFLFILASILKQIKTKHEYLLELLTLVIVASFIYGIYQLSVYFFIHFKIVTPIVNPSIAVIFGYFGSSAFNFYIERKKNVQIKSMFSQYVSGVLVNQLLEDPSKLKLGGEKKALTILFSDIVNFTAFSEDKEPEEVVKIMNYYLTEMTEIILRSNGTLDKYLGDAIMAFWGAPLPLENHAYKACEAAILMTRKIEELAKKESDVKKRINIRVGINTGNAVVGNIGGEKRFDYTVMGDNVNLASRLEGANREYGSQIMISDKTYQMVKDRIVVRMLDHILVKGKQRPTKVYEILGFAGEKEAEEKLKKLEPYLMGYEEYIKKNFNSAMDYFDRAIQLNPNDRPSWTHLERCQYYLENPPEEDWNGVFEFKTK
ncbi:MAG: CHASE2 domain-containing protein [Chlorobi bacterium]|nr:CHASE2 domain-containing protein [Chlorobiota bacterium]